MEQTRQSEKDVIAELLESMMGIVISIEIPIIRMSEAEKEVVDEFLEELSELAFSIVHNKDVQEDITIIAETLLLKEEIKVAVLKRITIDIAIILKYSVSKIKHPDQKEVQELLTEYLNEQEPTHCVLAQKMLDDMDFVSKAGLIYKKWIQIETDLIEEAQEDMCDTCDQCLKRELCDQLFHGDT